MRCAFARPRLRTSPRSLRRKACEVFLGTALLLAAVVGSGIMGERLAAGNVAIALLANTIATGAALQTPPCDPQAALSVQKVGREAFAVLISPMTL